MNDKPDPIRVDPKPAVDLEREETAGRTDQNPVDREVASDSTLPSRSSIQEIDGDPFAVELPGTKNYGICLYMFAQALANGHYHDALVLARQAEMIGAMTDGKTRLPRVTNAYARILIASCIKLRADAMENGDIEPSSVDLTDTAIGASKNLLNRLTQHGRDNPISLSKRVLERLTAAKAIAQEPRKRKRPIKSNALADYLDAVNDAIELASRLDITGGEANLSLASRAKTATATVQTAQEQLRYWFAKQRSDWEKAAVLTRHAADILSPKPNVMEGPLSEADKASLVADGLLIPSTGTEVASAIALIRKLTDALSSRDYNQSVALFKTVNGALKEI